MKENKCSGTPAATVNFGMFTDGAGFLSVLLTQIEDGNLVLRDPYHFLHTGQRMPLDLIVCLRQPRFLLQKARCLQVFAGASKYLLVPTLASQCTIFSDQGS